MGVTIYLMIIYLFLFVADIIVFFHVYKEISREQGNRLFLEMYKSIKKKFKILKEILKQKNKYIKNLFYIKYKIKIS